MKALSDSAWLQEQLTHSGSMLAGAWAAIPAEHTTTLLQLALFWDWGGASVT